jgi:hypothetical protein
MSTQIHCNLDCFELRKSCNACLGFETLNQCMEYEQTLKLKGKQKFARNKVKELFTYNTWDKSRSVGVVGEKFDIIFSQVQLMFSLRIFDIQSMFWEPNCIWFGWNGHNQMKMLAFFFYQGKSTASHKTCLFHLYSKWVVGVEWGSTESIFLGTNLKEW